MLALVAQATFLRPSLRAYSNANRDDLLASPSRVIELQRLRDARRLHVLDAGVEVLDVLADDDQVDARGRSTGVVTPGISRTGRTLA